MKKHFITYADEKYTPARTRIIFEAKKTGEFDVVRAYGREDVSDAVKSSPLFSKPRGGGYWCWKPDIIVSELSKIDENDIIVYVDSGCEVLPGREWKRYWKILKHKELIVQKIYQVNEKWTRQSIIEAFSTTPRSWLKKCQFLSGVIIARKTSNTIKFFEEWRQYMITNPQLAQDIEPSERKYEAPCFIENRHDQAILSALVYKYLATKGAHFIADEWEHVENQSLFRSHVIRAMRWNLPSPIPFKRRLREIILRLGKDLLLKPFYLMKMTFVKDDT